MATHKELTEAIQAELDKLAMEYQEEESKKIVLNEAIDQQRQEDDGAWLEEMERQEREEQNNAHLTLVPEEEAIFFGNAASREHQCGPNIAARP